MLSGYVYNRKLRVGITSNPKLCLIFLVGGENVQLL
jgi:hypothetical protein